MQGIPKITVPIIPIILETPCITEIIDFLDPKVSNQFQKAAI